MFLRSILRDGSLSAVYFIEKWKIELELEYFLENFKPNSKLELEIRIICIKTVKEKW